MCIMHKKGVVQAYYNLSILPCFCPYISRFSGRGRWILCVVADVAEIIVSMAMQNGHGPKNFVRALRALTHLRLATMHPNLGVL